MKPDGVFELLAPAAAGAGQIRDFVSASDAWIERQLRLWRAANPGIEPGARVIGPGSRVVISGEDAVLKFSGTAAGARLTGDGAVLMPERCLGRERMIRRELELLCRRLVREKVFPMLRAMAERHDVRVSGLRISGAAGRWGSCSSRRRIALSWRVARLEAPLAELIAAHELAHLKEMNHSAAFYAELERLLPEWRQRRNLLKEKRWRYADW